MSAPTRARARLFLVLAAILFATGGPAIKACSLGAWQIACLRSGVATLALCLFARPPLEAFRGGAALVGLAHGATLVLFVSATKLTTASHAIFLQDSSVLYVLLLSPLLLSERLFRHDGLVMLLVVAGMGLLFAGDLGASPTAPDPLLGNSLAAASGVTWALTVVGMRTLARRDGARTQGALAAVVCGNAFACLATLWPAWAAGGGVPPGTLGALGGFSGLWGQNLAWVLYLGVVQIALAYVFVARGLAGVTALEGALILLLEPLLNSLFTWALHGEAPGALAWLGGAAILAGTGVKAWFARGEPRD
jgi:DME family drug/metabolite transporter